MSPFTRVPFIVKMQEAIPDVDAVEIGCVDCFRQIYREQGIFGFWRGNLINVFRFVPVQLGNLAFKDGIKRAFPTWDLKDPEVEARFKAEPYKSIAKLLFSAWASDLAVNAMNVAVEYPIDSVYISLLSDMTTGAGGSASGFFSRIGFTSLYAGCGACLLEHFLQWQTFKHFWFPLNQRFGKGSFSYLVHRMASSLSLFVVYGFQTVRRRLQLQMKLPEERQPYKNSFDCVKKIYTEEGMLGFYKGFVLTLVEQAVAGAVVFVGSAMCSRVVARANSSGTSRKAPTSEQLTAVFNRYDLNRDGFITLDELRIALKDKHQSDIQHIFNSFDRDGDGQITLAEFLLYMQQPRS